jgi:hypothetical protein
MKNIIRFIIAFFVLAGLFYLFQVGTEEESFRATKREEPTVQRIEATDAPPKDSSSEPSTSKQEKRIEQLEKQNDRLRSQVKKLEEEVEFLSTPGALPPGTVHLKAGEEWIVDGQWKLKVTSATALKERNRYVSEKPAEVVRILYTYENLGYRNGKIDLYFYPDSVVDGAGKVGYSYGVGSFRYPDQTPIGAICEDVSATWGLPTASDTIQVSFVAYDDEGNRSKAVFEVPVTK